jgi:SAM-dependent methyltransferase
MLTNILHRIVAHPWIYDKVQELAGVRQIHRRLSAQIAPLGAAALIIDLGAGTGLVRDLWPRTCTYVCLDQDMLKIRGFLNKCPDGIALCADATRLPIRNECIEVIICTFVAHHLPDQLLADLIDESSRILKQAGTYIFVDPLWAPRRWAGRLLWRLDRGAYPRTERVLHSVLANRFEVAHWEQFSVYHEYTIGVGTKPDDLESLTGAHGSTKMI